MTFNRHDPEDDKVCCSRCKFYENRLTFDELMAMCTHGSVDVCNRELKTVKRFHSVYGEYTAKVGRKRCDEVNKDGQCEHFVDRSLWRRFLDWI